MVPVNNCDILIMKGKIGRSSYVSILPYRIEQEKFIYLNTQLESLAIN